MSGQECIESSESYLPEGGHGAASAAAALPPAAAPAPPPAYQRDTLDHTTHRHHTTDKQVGNDQI